MVAGPCPAARMARVPATCCVPAWRKWLVAQTPYKDARFEDIKVLFADEPTRALRGNVGPRRATPPHGCQLPSFPDRPPRPGPDGPPSRPGFRQADGRSISVPGGRRWSAGDARNPLRFKKLELVARGAPAKLI